MNKNSFAKTPPMGWNSWDCYGAAVTEEQLLANAEYMAENLKQFGWQYVVCDIQWFEPTAHSNNYNNFTELCMDEYSRLIPAPNRFPSSANGAGFKPIADKIHAMGLKFGIHILRGIPRQAVHRNTNLLYCGKTARQIAHSFSLCPWNTDMYGIDMSREGAQEYYNSIFELYASWGVDFVKVDDIANTEFKPHDPYSAKSEIEAIRKAIDNCGREIVLSLSPGPAPIEHVEHLSENANMWRMTGDFWDHWDKLKKMFDYCEKWYPYVKEGCWPDCDMLPLGRLCLNAECNGAAARYTGFTHAEQITMLTLWSIFRSPLMLGGEQRENDEFTLSIITNPEVIAVNQHSHSGKPVYSDEKIKIWQCTDENGKKVIGIFNIDDEPCAYTLSEELTGKDFTLRDLWARENIGKVSEITVDAHGARMFTIN